MARIYTMGSVSGASGIPPRVEAAQSYLHFAAALKTPGAYRPSLEGDTPQADGELSKDEQATYNAALTVLRLYFSGEMDYGDAAWRWLGGTPVIPALYAATEGPRIVREAGIEAVRAKSVRQTERLIALADARGYAVAAPRDATRRGGTVAFDVPHAYEIAQLLLARGVVVDYRPGAGIRLGPHFYTEDSELEQAVRGR